MHTLQKANVGKRIIAAIFDGVLLSVLVVGLIALFSFLFQTDAYLEKVNNAYAKYETAYGIEFQISQEEYEALSEQKQQDWDTAYQELTADNEAMYAYNMWVNLTLLITTFGVLLGVVIIEFILPLFFRNGQTLGKKIFGIALMHKDGIRVNNVQLFTRAVLGKFAIELMIPLYIVLMIALNSIGVISIVVLLALAIAQVVCLIVTRTNSLLHDVLAGTVAVDMESQRIFENREELIEYTKKLHAKQVGEASSF